VTHPFESWPRSRRREIFIALVVVALLPSVLGFFVKPLHEDKPGGESIIEFELAGSVDRANEILDKWRAEGVIDNAKAIQVFDLVYPLIYASALAGGCLLAAGAWRRAGHAGIAAAGIAMAWLALAAAGFDYVENLGLGISLWDEPASPWPQVSAVAAVIKFTAIAVTLLYSLSAFIASRLAPRARPA
jgi:subtilisin family serine protease